ncbi:MAG: glycosyltransferase [Bacteroidia bacterium]
MSSSIKLSIIIPVYKDLKGLQQTISHLRKSEITCPYEIIVCNDGSERLISDWLADQGIFEVKITTQKGSYYARNRGIETAKGNWLLFADAGIIIKPNWFKLIETKLVINSYIAFDINLQINPGMRLMKQYSQFYEFRCKSYWEQNHFGPTAFLLVQKSVFEETGMFNETLYSGGDFELGNRCWHANKKMYFVENNQVYHAPRSLWAKYKKQVRVLQGIKQLKKLYTSRIMKLPEVSWAEFFKGPLKFAYTIYKIKKQPAVVEGNWHISKVIWAEFWHQKMYYWALLKVLTTNKAHLE